MNVGEEDGRSCYGVIAETSSSISSGALQVLKIQIAKYIFDWKSKRTFIFKVCQAGNKHTWRPALPHDIEIVNTMKKPPLWETSLKNFYPPPC